MLRSIHETPPTDLSGRHARNGFMYQDHIGAGFCLEMLIQDDIDQIWFESHDDITIIRQNGEDELVEFVQVKATNPTSRWSVDNITKRDNGRGLSLFEKSLHQHKCKEQCAFRIITSYDVTDELSILKFKLDTIERLDCSKKLEELATKIQRKFKSENIKSKAGSDITYWVKNCLWDKRSDSSVDVENSNTLLIEKILRDRSHFIQAEHRDELYMKLLKRVIVASTKDIIKNPNCYKISRVELEEWLEKQLVSFNKYSNSSEIPLREKMQEASLPEPIVNTAQELFWNYTLNSRSPTYYNEGRFNLIESELIHKLSYFHEKQYGDALNYDPLDFYFWCMKELDEISQNEKFEELEIDSALVKGCYHSLVNRCLVRYKI